MRGAGRAVQTAARELEERSCADHAGGGRVSSTTEGEHPAERRRLMSDLTLDQTNDGHRGTEIQAQDGFSEHYVFQANATHISNTDQRYVDGLHGFGYGDGRGIVGVGGSQPNSPIDDLDSSSTELNAQGQGVLGVGGDERPGWTAGEGVRGIGGRGISRTRGASGVYGKGGVYGGHGVLGVAGGVEGSGSGVLGFAERDDRDEEATCGRGGTFV